MFESLKGIQKGRNIQQRPESPLEKLLKIEQEVRQKYAGKVSDSWKQDYDNIYIPMYQSLSLPDYTEQDLQSLLLAKANNNYPDKEAKVLGMYTGVLLHVLTERVEKEGKKAVFTFDLHGSQFNYLFYFAKRAGEVTVKNVKGNYACSFLASYDGTAEKVVLEGNEGKDAACWAGSTNGNVGTLVIQGNKGDAAAYRAGNDNGNVGTLVIHGNKGDWAAYSAGRNGGKVGTLALYNAGRYAGINAFAKRIITGEEALALYQRLEKELPCLKA